MVQSDSVTYDCKQENVLAYLQNIKWAFQKCELRNTANAEQQK